MLAAMIVTVTSHKGGVAKSVTAVHLAALFVREFGKGSTVLIDADPNASALEWAGRAESNGRELPFDVMGLRDDPGEREHAIVDSPGRLKGEDLEEAAYESDLLVVPTVPDALSISALAAFLEDLDEFEGHAEHKILLTMIPWWNLSGVWARRDLSKAGIPMFEGQVRLREAVRTAALEGMLVNELKGRGARQVWEDYERIGREILGGA